MEETRPSTWGDDSERAAAVAELRTLATGCETIIEACSTTDVINVFRNVPVETRESSRKSGRAGYSVLKSVAKDRVFQLLLDKAAAVASAETSAPAK